MFLEIEHRSGIPIYRQIMRQIRYQIISGRLAAGQRLTSVRALAKELKVNPMTISKAYTLLEHEGLLERRRGVGLFVANVEYKDVRWSRTKMFDDVFRRAALTAVQLGLSEKEFQRQLLRLYRKYHPTKQR